jgi:hypothetical protein
LKTSEFLKIKTNYLSIGINSILIFGVLLLLIFIETLVFFLLYGSGASSSRIAKLRYMDFILNSLPIVLVALFLVYKTLKRYKEKEYVKFKTNLFTLLIVLFLFSIKDQINQLIF